MLNFEKIALALVLGVMLISKVAFARGQSELPPDPAAKARLLRFDSIWRQRTQKNVVPRILPFVRDPYPPLRTRAVQSLGMLENPASKSLLQSLLAQMKIGGNQNKPNEIPLITLQLALGRINSRNLKGKAKIETILKSVGLTWTQFTQLVRQVNAPRPFEDVVDPANEIVNYVVDVLYLMGKRGEPVKGLATGLALSTGQQLKIQASSLTTDKEVQLLLNFLLNQYPISFDSPVVVAHLVQLGPAATTAILYHLQKMKQNPQNYSGSFPSKRYPGIMQPHKGYVGLFSAASRTETAVCFPCYGISSKKGKKVSAEKRKSRCDDSQCDGVTLIDKFLRTSGRVSALFFYE